MQQSNPRITIGASIAKGISHGTAGPDNVPCVIKDQLQAGELQVLTELHEYEDQPWAEHIIKCFPQWKEQFKGQILLPLEYCDHGNLESVLLRGYDGRHLTYEERKQMLHGIVKGLALMHSLGYVHRDLKPSNVLVGSYRTASKLADFGLTIKAGDECDSQGSLGYLPPEWSEGVRAAQFTQDIFSLGICAYQLLAMHKGARVLPHPFDSAQTHEDNHNRALYLHGNIKKYQLSSNFSIQDELTGNLIESMLQRDPHKRPTVDAVLAHPLFWTAADREQHVSVFLRHGDKQLLGRMFCRLAGQDPRAPALTNPGNPYLPLCIVTMQDFLDTKARGNPCDDGQKVCSSACCQLFMSKHGDTDPGTLGGCPQCMARVDHFCNEISYDKARFFEDPNRATLWPSGNEFWHTLQLKRELSPYCEGPLRRTFYDVLLNGSIGGPGNSSAVNVYNIDPSTATAEGDQPEFVVARCWVTLFSAADASVPADKQAADQKQALDQQAADQKQALDQQAADQHASDRQAADQQAADQQAADQQAAGLLYPLQVLPSEQQAFKIIPFRYTSKTPRKSPCPAHLHCFASLISPLSTAVWARECCSDFFYHKPLQLCSGCTDLKEHICTKHSHEGSVRLDLLKDVPPPRASAGIWNVYTEDRVTYWLPQLDPLLAHLRFVIVMRYDPIGPPSTSRLCRIPLPVNQAQATCLFGPYCSFPLSCPMAHPVSLIKPKGLDGAACLSASLEDEMAIFHPELCPDCSNLYADAGSKREVPDLRSHYCNGRNYHGFVVESASETSAGRKTQYQLWHIRKEEHPSDEAEPRFNVYGLVKVTECSCQEAWMQRLGELQAKPEEDSEGVKHELLKEICRGCNKAGDHWIDVADRLFVGYNHLPGMLHLSTMNPDQKKKALESNRAKQRLAAEAGVRAGFEGRHGEFVVAVQQCDVRLGGPARARLLALPYSIFGRDMCPEGHGCPHGLACSKFHSPAGDATASSAPVPPLDGHAQSKPTAADVLRSAKAKGRHNAPQGPQGISPHEFPELSQKASCNTTRCESHSSSTAWQFEEPGVEVTSGKPVDEGSAQGSAASLATPSGKKARKKPQKVPLYEHCARIAEEEKNKRHEKGPWGRKPR